MNIQLIYPTRLDENRNPIKYKKALQPPLALAVLNRLTPAGHHVRVVNDVVEDIDYSRSYDLVGITAMTAQVDRAYQVADRFREPGVRVIIGGLHATALPHEAKKHADSVVIGEAEGLWEQILADFENNSFKEFYQDPCPGDLQRLIIPNWDNMNMKIYLKPLGQSLPRMPIFTTRGCVYDCKFCTVSKFFGKTYRTKPIPHVLKEIDSTNQRYYFLVDDNIAGNCDHSRELFKALIPKKITWFSQISTNVLKTPDLIDLAARAGCDSMFIGIESINKKNLKSVNKSFNHPEAYKELFDRMRKAGIIACPNIMLGFDNDTPEQLQLTVDFLNKCKLGAAFFSVLTPVPGTELYREMKEAGRLLTTNWSHYDMGHIVFQPKNFTADEFMTHFWKTYQRHFSFRKIAKRLFYIVSMSRHPVTSFLESFIYKMYNRRKVYSQDFPISDGMFKVKRKKKIPGSQISGQHLT